MQCLERLRQKSVIDQSKLEDTLAQVSGSTEQSANESYSEYENEPEISDSTQWKKRKLNLQSTSEEFDDLPIKNRHIRASKCKVRPEVYEAMDKLKSVYHLSECQAAAAVVTIGNKLFSRNWKFQDESASEITLNTLLNR